jgi:hypothetical protein
MCPPSVNTVQLELQRCNFLGIIGARAFEPVAPDPEGVGLFAPPPPEVHDEIRSTTPITIQNGRRPASQAAMT